MENQCIGGKWGKGKDLKGGGEKERNRSMYGREVGKGNGKI